VACTNDDNIVLLVSAHDYLISASKGFIVAQFSYNPKNNHPA
jgi:hypothetical protein